MEMIKEFIPYEQALALKELGFNQPCIGFFENNGKNSLLVTDSVNFTNTDLKVEGVSSPLFQQAFRWFREKYNLQCSINFYSESLGIKKVPNHYEIQIDYLSNNKWCYFENINNKIYLTYEEAELECIKKLIEITKTKQNEKT